MTVQNPSPLALRYANALLDLAEEKKLTQKVEQDLQDISAMADASAELRHVIHSPAISSTNQIKVIEAISSKAKFQKITENFLKVLVQNGRIDILPDVLNACYFELDKRAGRIMAEVQVAQDLSPAQKKDLLAALKKQHGADVNLSISVKPEILGGMIITVGSVMIDDSVKGKIQRLKAQMLDSANTNINTNLSKQEA